MKIQSDVLRPFSIEVEQSQPEQAPVVSDRPQQESSSFPIQQSTLANARKNESMFSTSMQRAMLDAALITKPGTGTEIPTPAGTPAPEAAPEKSAPAGETPKGGEGLHHHIGYGKLKLNDKGPEVERLQGDLNRWREMNGLPKIAESGTFSTETQDAVKEFQRATNLKDTGETEDNTGLRLSLELDPQFQELNADVKERINAAYSSVQNDPKGRDNLLDLIDEKQFLYLISPEAQDAAIKGLMMEPGNPQMLGAIKHYLPDAAILENDPNYDNLSQEIKEKAMTTMFYRIGLYGGVGSASGDRHNVISSLVADPNFGKRSLDEQHQLLDIVSQNNDGPIGMNVTASNLERMLKGEAFTNLSAEMQTQVIDLIQNNVSIGSGTGNWPKKDNVENIIDLLRTPAFKALSEEEKRARLEQERKKVFFGDR
jgi:peptidoglycan hydrolase-like protein with peptidoglycan-binding domain